MPTARRWQQSGARRGWSIHEELQQQASLRVLQGRRPPSVEWPFAGAQQTRQPAPPRRSHRPQESERLRQKAQSIPDRVLEPRRDTPEPPRTAPADFAQELAQLRVCVRELTRERDDLRSELSKHCSEERQKKTRVVDPLQEVALGDTLVGATDRSNRQSIKFDGDVDRQGRRRVFGEIQSPFQPDVMGAFCFVMCSRYGLHGELYARDVVDELPTTVVASQCPARIMHRNLWHMKLLARYGLRAHRVGEASHPCPRTRN